MLLKTRGWTTITANGASIRVLPSGAASFTACAAIRPPAPGRFSTSTGTGNEGDPNLPKLLGVTENNAAFATCLEVAERALQGLLVDPVSGADHYRTAAVAPAWAHGRTSARRIDDHLFYNDIP